VKTQWAETLFKKADDISGELTDIRRQIHGHPELGSKETATAHRICENLKDLEIPFRTSPAQPFRFAGCMKSIGNSLVLRHIPKVISVDRGMISLPKKTC